MRKSVIPLIGVLAGILIVCGGTSASAQVLLCPQPADLKTPESASGISAVLPKGLALQNPDQLQSAIVRLREHGMSADDTINHLVALYCPAVSAEAGLSHAQKLAKVQSFAALASSQVGAEANIETILVTVPLPPGIVEAASRRARQDGLSLGAWIAKTVSQALP